MIIWWFPEIEVPQSSNSLGCVDIHGDLRYQPYIWKNNIHAPNHQPVIVTSGYIYMWFIDQATSLNIIIIRTTWPQRPTKPTCEARGQATGRGGLGWWKPVGKLWEKPEKMRISMGIFHGRWKLPWNIDGKKVQTHIWCFFVYGQIVNQLG